MRTTSFNLALAADGFGGGALEDARYHSITRAGGGGTIRVRGRFGSRLWTTLVGLVPLGAHTRWGKRLVAQATVRGEGA